MGGYTHSERDISSLIEENQEVISFACLHAGICVHKLPRHHRHTHTQAGCPTGMYVHTITHTHTHTHTQRWTYRDRYRETGS